MNLREILTDLDILFVGSEHHHCNVGWLAIDCPWCGKDTHRYHLGINLDGNFCTCWRCGHKNLKSALKYTTGKGSHIDRMLGDLDYTPVDRTPRTGKLKYPNGIHDIMGAHERYLEDRGFDPETIRKLWGVRCIPVHPTLSWRLWIPILTRGEIVSWTTRGIGKAEPKYRNAPIEHEAVSAKTLLYGEDYCRHAVMVHEGPIDVWKTGPGAVATMGLNVSRPQILRLTRYPIRVICFDNEPRALIRAKKLADRLEVFPGETTIVELDSADPGSATPYETSELRKFLEVG